MRNLIIAACLGFATAAPASACSCAGPSGERQKREFAREMARSVVAVAEIVGVEQPDYNQPPRYRVVRNIVGAAPKTFVDESDFEPADPSRKGLVRPRLMTTCHAAPSPGQRRIVALYPRLRREDTGYPLPDRELKRRIAASRKAKSLEVGNMCAWLFLESPGVLQMIRDEARKLGRTVSR